jgi:molecular chaperone DnaK
LKKAMETSDAGEIKRLSDELTQTSHKLAEKMYSQASQQGPGAGPEAGAQAGAGHTSGKKADDDVVDADFEEVK